MDKRHSSPWLAATAIGLAGALHPQTLEVTSTPGRRLPPIPAGFATKEQAWPAMETRREMKRRRPARRTAQNQGRR